jgi:hypothetical protein
MVMMIMVSISPFGPVGCGRPLRGGEMSKANNRTPPFREAFWQSKWYLLVITLRCMYVDNFMKVLRETYTVCFRKKSPLDGLIFVFFRILRNITTYEWL